MAIQCSEINQTANYLIGKFQDCTKLEAADMQLLVELILAVNICANGGANYSTLNNDIYEPVEDLLVNYPVNTFHSISLVVVSGTAIYDSITLSAGTSINLEFSTLNQTEFEFIVKAGSKILINYITETI